MAILEILATSLLTTAMIAVSAFLIVKRLFSEKVSKAFTILAKSPNAVSIQSKKKADAIVNTVLEKELDKIPLLPQLREWLGENAGIDLDAETIIALINNPTVQKYVLPFLGQQGIPQPNKQSENKPEYGATRYPNL